jgi:hypothetical protein
MEFYTGKNPETPDAQEFFSNCSNLVLGSSPGALIDAMAPEALMNVDPGLYGPRFAAIAELRAMDDGTLHRGNEFRRVASLVNVPLANAISMTEPGFLKDKRTFYKWLAKHPECKTYDARGGSRPTVTYSGGLAVA